MSRPATFDRDAVLDRAVQAFWREGYAGTSIADLEAATGLRRGSLYAAFGDKHGLFAASLARYAETVSARTFAPLMAPDADLDEVEAVFLALAEPGAAPAPGCLVTNTAVELGPHDAAFGDLVAAALDRLERRLQPVLARAAARGQLRADLDPADAAALLVALAQGLRVLARAGQAPAARRRAVSTAFATLRPPTPRSTP